jgi:hypothetical protein
MKMMTKDQIIAEWQSHSFLISVGLVRDPTYPAVRGQVIGSRDGWVGRIPSPSGDVFIGPFETYNETVAAIHKLQDEDDALAEALNHEDANEDAEQDGLPPFQGPIEGVRSVFDQK